MSIVEITNIIEKISKPSTIIAVIIISIISVIIYVLNIPYSYVEKPLGISKYNKKNVIPFIVLIFCVMILGFLIFLFTRIQINSSKNTNSSLFKGFGKLVIFYTAYVFLTIVSIKVSIFFKKNLLNFLNNRINVNSHKIFKQFIKHKNFNMIILMALIIINTFFACWIVYNTEYIFLKVIVGIILLGNVVLNISIYSYFENANKLMNLNLRELKLKNSTLLYCRIIYQNDKYTCVYHNQKIAYIDSSEIFSIEGREF